MAGNCIIDDEVCREASLQEIIRRYYKCSVRPESQRRRSSRSCFKLELLMNQAGVAPGEPRGGDNSRRLLRGHRPVRPAAAIELADGSIVTGKTGRAAGRGVLGPAECAEDGWPASTRRSTWYPAKRASSPSSS